MKKKKYTTVQEVAQAIGANAYGLRLLEYLDQYHPDLALDYDYIMERANRAAQAGENYVREHGTNELRQMEASEAANEVLMAGLGFSKFDEVFRICAQIIYDAGILMPDDDTRQLVARQLLPKFESIFLKYPISNPDFTAEVEYDEMREKLTKKAEKLLAPIIQKERDALPF